MCDVLESLDSDNAEEVIGCVRESVKALCGRFPVYGD
jgi:hypothetical protein